MNTRFPSFIPSLDLLLVCTSTSTPANSLVIKPHQSTTMRYHITMISLASMATLSRAKDCEQGQECVNLYSGGNCDPYLFELSYQPTCEGNCYVFPFTSLRVKGTYFLGTNCHAYSDTNCQDEIGSTGNVVGTGSGECTNFGGGQSMKCYYDC